MRTKLVLHARGTMKGNYWYLAMVGAIASLSLAAQVQAQAKAKGGNFYCTSYAPLPVYQDTTNQPCGSSNSNDQGATQTVIVDTDGGELPLVFTLTQASTTEGRPRLDNWRLELPAPSVTLPLMSTIQIQTASQSVPIIPSLGVPGRTPRSLGLIHLSREAFPRTPSSSSASPSFPQGPEARRRLPSA